MKQVASITIRAGNSAIDNNFIYNRNTIHGILETSLVKSKMRIFIDCEFNGFGGDLISLALVADDGSEFYEVLHLQNDEKYGSWVAENVVPYLNKHPISKQAFQQKLWQFINCWESVHIIADWPDDIKYFCEALITGPGTAINTPLNLTMQIDRELNTASSAILHNALEDARAIRRSWKRREREARGYGVKEHL